MRILILYNDRSDMAEVYGKDGIGREEYDDIASVRKALESYGHTVTEMTFDLDSYEKFRHLKDVDMIFNLCDEGYEMNPLLEPHISAIMELLDVPYLGPDAFCLATSTKKDLTKDLMVQHGIRTPKYQLFKTGKEKLHLNYPLFVKPVHEDGSIGIREDSHVRNKRELDRKVAQILKDHKQPALVEEYIDGREFKVGLLGNADVRALPVLEVDFTRLPADHKKFCLYDTKWALDSAYYKDTIQVCPAKIPKKMAKEIQEMAIAAFKLMRCRDYARIDFRADKNNVPYILEVNANPGLTEDASMVTIARGEGKDYAALINAILDEAVKRWKKRK